MRKYNNFNKSHGFGLVEVLISSVVLAIGLLGLALTQTKATRLAQESDNLSTAAMIANDMVSRMLLNKYITAQGKQGYLLNDFSGAIDDDTDIPTWAAGATTANVLRCYSGDINISCFADGANIHSRSDHLTALGNLKTMDEIELRQLAWEELPEGKIKLCFDTTNPTTTWTCDNLSTLNTREESVFTVKIQWRNLLDDSLNLYVTQFAAPCTDPAANACG